MTKPKTVRVNITARQVVHYNQIVTMTVQEWERFKAKSPEEHTMHGGDLPIDTRNIYDADDIEFDAFDACVIDKDNKPTNDEYTWDE